MSVFSKKKIKTIIRIVSVIIMSVTIASLLPACLSPDERETKARELLNEKYNREFEIVDVYRAGVSLSYFEAWAYDTGNPEILFNVTVNNADDNFSDTYVQKCVCAKLSDAVAQKMDSFPGSYYVYSEAEGMQPYSDNPEISINDYWALDKDNHFKIEIFTVPETEDPSLIYIGIQDILSDYPYIDAAVKLYVVSDAEMAEIQDYLETNDKMYMDYKEKTMHYFSVDLNVENGLLTNDPNEFNSKVGAVL